VAFLTVQGLRLKASRKPAVRLIGTGLAGHLRYRRETLGLTRKEAARQIGVLGAAVGQWETGEHHPEAEYWPGIIRFIGYDPICSDPQTAPEKIAFLCRHKGVPRSGLATLLGIDKATVLSWEQGCPQRAGWTKVDRLDYFVRSARTGERVPEEATPRQGLAEALFRTRKERALTQKATAELLGVDPATYKLWESGRRNPYPRSWPSILKFLGRDPICERPGTVAEKIGVARRRHGLSYQALGKLIGGSEHVVLRLESGRTAPKEGILAILEALVRTGSAICGNSNN